MKTIEVRARAFAGRGVERITAAIDESGTVRVWDDVAGHYTICHSLSPAAQARIRKLAKEAI